MGEPCQFCGRFMKHVWFLATDEPDSWEDYWECSRNEQHRIDYPWAYGIDPISQDSQVTP